MNKKFLFIIFLIIMIALTVYFYPYLRDKIAITEAFENVLVYSTDGKCEETKFDFYNNYFSYDPTFRCFFNIKYAMNETVDKYISSLESNGWQCIGDEYNYQPAAGKRKFYERFYEKEDFELELYFITLSEGTILYAKQVEVDLRKISDDKIGRIKRNCTAWHGFEE